MVTTHTPLEQRVPSLAEAGAIEALAAAGWRGYQRHGRGVVFYSPDTGQVYYRTTAELREHALLMRSNHAAGLRLLADEAERHDPHVVFVLSVLLTDTDRWIAEVVTPPRRPAQCRPRWQPRPR